MTKRGRFENSLRGCYAHVHITVQVVYLNKLNISITALDQRKLTSCQTHRYFTTDAMLRSPMLTACLAPSLTSRLARSPSHPPLLYLLTRSSGSVFTLPRTTFV